MWCRLWLLAVILMIDKIVCNPVSTNFNTNIREYSVTEEVDNMTNVNTLQKEQFGRYASFAPAMKPIRFKEIPDNVISGSTHGRELVHYPGYDPNDFDDSHGYGYGYEYEADPHVVVEHHGYSHHGHGLHHGHGHKHHGHGHRHHHKFHDSALIAKTVLWPIAGIALLGAAAAIVSNPVLLQLGVISGRRRRDTEEVYGPDVDINFSDFARKIATEDKKIDGNDNSGSTKVTLVSNKAVTPVGAVKVKLDANAKEMVKPIDENDVSKKLRAKYFEGNNFKGNEIGNVVNNMEINNKITRLPTDTGKEEKRKWPKRIVKDAKRATLSEVKQSTIADSLYASVDNRNSEEDRFVPIRLKLKNN